MCIDKDENQNMGLEIKQDATQTMGYTGKVGELPLIFSLLNNRQE